MSVTSAQPLLGTRSVRGDVLIVGLATTYVTISTADVKLAGIPLKLFAVLLALGTWLISARPWERTRAFRFRIPVLVTGVGVPIAWFAIAAVLVHSHDPAQRDGISNAVQEASRFVYLLLYFPLADREWLGSGWERLWVWPALLLCAITLALFAGHLLGADYGTSGTVGPFQGSIGVSTSGAFRDFLVNDIVFLPLFALLVARVVKGAITGAVLVGIVVVLGCAFLAHARGVWLAMSVTVAVMALAAIPAAWPGRLRRAAWCLAGLGGVGALVVLADPDVARHLVRVLSNRGELSTALRLDQAPELLRGFRRDVIFGSGLGAVLPSGFVRDPSTPWTFELTYLQLLFEVGTVGLALVLAPAIACLWRAARSLRGRMLWERPLGFALLGGLTGFLLAAAGNPYLLTSVGMYTLAVFMATAERELSGPPVARRAGRPVVATFAAVALAVFGLTALEFRASRAAASGSGIAASVTRLEVPASARQLLRQPLASELTRRRLWAFAPRRGRLEATPLTVAGARLVVGTPRELWRPASGASYQVADWNGSPVAFEMTTGRASLTVRALSLSGRRQPLDRIRGVLPQLTRGWVRYVAVGTDANGTVDAVAIDRSPIRRRMRVSWFALTPGGRPRTFERTAALGPFTPGRWVVRLGSVLKRGPDLGLIGTPPGGELQIRVLSASNGYDTSGEQGVIALPLMPRRPLEYLISERSGAPVVYTVDPSVGDVEELGL